MFNLSFLKDKKFYTSLTYTLIFAGIFLSLIYMTHVRFEHVKKEQIEREKELEKSKIGDRDREKYKILSSLERWDREGSYTVLSYINKKEDLKKTCHDIAHDLGHKAFEIYGFEDALYFKDLEHLRLMQHSCAGGYLHGVVESLVEKDKDINKNINNFCSKVSNLFMDHCYHAIGHGVMLYHDNEVLSQDSCKQIKNKNHRARCAEGFWMEYYYGDGENDVTSDIKFSVEDIFAPCETADTYSKAACYLYSSMGY